MVPNFKSTHYQTQPPRIGACHYRVGGRDNPRIKSGDDHDGESI
jgi:hypothetical protein